MTADGTEHKITRSGDVFALGDASIVSPPQRTGNLIVYLVDRLLLANSQLMAPLQSTAESFAIPIEPTTAARKDSR